MPTSMPGERTLLPENFPVNGVPSSRRASLLPKHRILMAALLAGSSSFACAQSSVTIYGVADAGLVLERGGAAGNVTAVSSGVASGNRLGFKGREDLGGGLAAIFNLENGYGIDTGAAGQGGLLFGRQAYAGLAGAAGTVTLGRQYSPWYKAIRDVADPFGIGMAGNAINVMVGNTRVDNMVEFQSVRYAGWSADVAYGAGETAGGAARNRSLGAGLSYQHGALQAVLVFHRRDNAAATDHAAYGMAVVKYDFGVLCASLAHARNRGLAGADSHDTLLGMTAPLGTGKLLASVISHRDESSAARHALQWAAGYSYTLSKRSDLYAAYGHIINDNGAAFKAGNGTDAGSGPTAINLGLRHVF
ncbi:porin [Pseudoduganella rivuli]|nr:porin [Pseudoduganella rivuli]